MLLSSLLHHLVDLIYPVIPRKQIQDRCDGVGRLLVATVAGRHRFHPRGKHLSSEYQIGAVPGGIGVKLMARLLLDARRTVVGRLCGLASYGTASLSHLPIKKGKSSLKTAWGRTL